jgi:mono/diheme cytochrome c family protein
MRIIMLAALAGVSVLLAGDGSRDVHPAMTSSAAASARTAVPGGWQQAGRSVFEGKGNCATCHGKDAKGTPLGPDLTDDEWLNVPGSTVDAIIALVRSGVAAPKKYPAPMPPMGGARLRDTEIDAVARYVISLGTAES